MMEKFFADMTVDDKKKMMKQMMGEGKNESDMMEKKSKMMEGCKEGEMPEMPQMMVEMMPKCLKMMLPNISKEKRIDFILEMVATLMEQGSIGMSEEEKKDFVAKVIEKVKT